MSEHSIEIMGQKLSYPSSWHGVAAVLFVCACIVAIFYVLDEKRIGAIGNAVAGVQSALKESEESNNKAQETIKNQAQEIESLTKALAELKAKSSSELSLNSKLLESLKSNREKTTESFSDYLSSQNRLSEKLQSLKLECPDCVSAPATSKPPELQVYLDALIEQKQELEFKQ